MDLVANGDKHYSLARIARFSTIKIPSLKATNKRGENVAHFQRAGKFVLRSQRFSLGYNVCRFQRLYIKL